MEDYFFKKTGRRDHVTVDDIREIIECYEYYLDTHAPMNNYDLAFVFGYSLATIQKIMYGKHPLQTKRGRKTGILLPRAPRLRELYATKTHCRNGHEFTKDSVYLYTRPNGQMTRKCRICTKASADKHRRKTQ